LALGFSYCLFNLSVYNSGKYLYTKGENMKISKTVEYGFLIVGHIAKYGNNDFVTASSIAKKHDIASGYIATVVTQLVRANILSPKMGPRGGFKLIIPANKISMLDIIEAVDGPLEQIVVTSEKTTDEPFMLNMETVCKDVIAKAKDTLHKAKISKLIK
jgi:Rrf2 family protein